MMLEKQIRVGVIGCGTISSYHIEAFKSLTNVKVIGVADINEIKAKNIAEKYNLNFFTTNYFDLLKKNVDIVSICTPSGLHHKIALDAINYRKHVIVEKPLAINLSQADEMIKASKKNDVKLSVILNHRFDPLSLEIKDALVKKKFGKLVLGDVQVKWFRSRDYYINNWRGTWNMDGGGVLSNQAIHWVDLLHWFLGPVKRVFGKTVTATHNIEGVDTAVALLEFKNGALGVIEASTSIYPGTKAEGFIYESLPERIGIYGENGSVEIEGSYEVKLWKFKEDDKERKDLNLNNKDVGHKAEIKSIIRAIRENKKVPIDGAEARKSLEIIRAVYYSSLTGKCINMPFKQERELDRLINSI